MRSEEDSEIVESQETVQNVPENCTPDTEGEEEPENFHQEEIVAKKGNTTSVIWNWFGYLKSDKAQANVKCKLCRRMVCSKTGNTTNLFHHLKMYHNKEWYESISLRFHASLPAANARQNQPAGPRGTVHSTPASSSSSLASVSGKQTVARQPTIQSAFSAAPPYKKKIDAIQKHNQSSDVLSR